MNRRSLLKIAALTGGYTLLSAESWAGGAAKVRVTLVRWPYT